MRSFSKSNNPVLNSTLFKEAQAAPATDAMTVGGTVNKTILLFLITVFTSFYAWKLMEVGRGASLIWVGAIGGFILAMITTFKVKWAHITAPLYAAFEGLFLGGISLYFANLYNGIVLQAVLLTFGVMLVVLLFYRMGLLKATPGFTKWLLIATGGIAGYYLLVIIFSFFGKDISVFAMGGIGIGIQLLIVGIAALNFVLDFNMIEQGAKQGAPKQYEWYGAFGLMVTLIWLYIEILRLLALFANRD